MLLQGSLRHKGGDCASQASEHLAPVRVCSCAGGMRQHEGDGESERGREQQEQVSVWYLGGDACLREGVLFVVCVTAAGGL